MRKWMVVSVFLSLAAVPLLGLPYAYGDGK
jgi:hypothetical protein